MKIALLHINDLALQLFTDDGDQSSELGFVQADDRGLVSGADARAKAWLHPQFSYTQHWQNLNQRPLKNASLSARNHADMAYAQLQKMFDGVDIHKLILSVPASLDDDQLALLLGLLQALKIEVCGIVDSALLTASELIRAVIELQQHQAVVSHLTRAGEELRVTRNELYADVGALAIYRDIARDISNQLITDTRYDPLHSAKAQQALHNMLPNWIAQLSGKSDYASELPSPQGSHTVRLNASRLQKLLLLRTQALKFTLANYATEQLAIAPKGDLLISCSPELEAIEVIADVSFAHRGLALGRAWLRDPPPLQRIQSVAISTIYGDKKSTAVRPVTEEATAKRATHVMYQYRVWNLNRPLGFTVNKEGLDVCYGHPDDADVCLSRDLNGLKITYQNRLVEVRLPKHEGVGEFLYLDDHKVTLIEVLDA